MPTVTPLYAALLALLLVALMLRVVWLRRRYRIGIGDGGERELAKAIRAHANASETIPLALVLMLLCEMAGYSAVFLHGVGLALLVGRGLHAWGLSHRSGVSFGRFYGMVLTTASVVTTAVALLVYVARQ